MRCGRADRVELDAFFLGHSGADEEEGVDAFREHYPHCADCAAAVADWMDFDGAMRAVAVEAGDTLVAHPEPEDLAGFAESPARMGEKAMLIESHLASCASCASELVLIRSFDPAMFGPQNAAMPARAHERTPAQAGLVDSLRGALADFVERLRGFDLMSPVPALAMALMVVAGLWLSGALEGLGGSRPESSEPQLVERSSREGGSGGLGLTPGTAPELSPELTPEPEEAEPLLAEQEVEQSEPEPEAALETSPPVELAQVEPMPGASPGTPESRPPIRPPTPTPESVRTPAAVPQQEEILLAAVTELPPPSYATPEGAESVVWMRQFGAVRSAPGAVEVLARAPGNHTGLTLSRSPRLWWALDQPTDLPIQITIVDGEAIDPIVRVELPGPHAAGLHAFDLSQQGVELLPDVDYRWFVSIVVDPDRPSRNPVSAGSLRVAGATDGRRETVSSASASARGNKFAELGLWYDAFDFYASLAEAHPEVEQLATYRDRLVEVAKQAP
jgi:Domain of Unknown Function (DUF928)